MTRTSATNAVARIGRDPAAFEAFYRDHVDAVQRFVARRVDDPHLAADLTADVFLAVIDSADGYRPELGEPGHWLFGVARNVVAADRRRTARGLRAASRVAGRALADADDIARLVDRIDAEAQARRLYRAMELLADGERAVLELVAIEGLAVKEAAAVLGIRPSTARVRLFRARRLMRDQLTPAPSTPDTVATEVLS
ncbi:RNA polymerase sigma factor [Goodfellowiella coeruleoviolacea]|uniref:RNA polymerase sigma-70 factor, ECF subfamily n=1 Tax=Goodfellowiella coeruleoviolacea TaxID=334858 RepID=A0AAE3KGN4_9PSEU|nr:RNA polymerase sigma factor [Goodfellowiella coeruleoviolacea]MCP2167436.1 RNA polymerase sigma-70 factor, ECF subfamily [Goodfellowiella coeruleoviolacea]